MPGKPGEIKLVSNAMANITRRNIMNLLADSESEVEDIGDAIGNTMLDYHLKILEQASLVEKDGTTVRLSEYGRNFLESKSEKGPEKRIDISKCKPVDIVEIKQLIPCIADRTRFRIIARMNPPLEGALKALEPLFPRGRYSEKIGALIIQRGDVLITIYGKGNVTMTMIKGESEAEEILQGLRGTINAAIEKGVAPVSREKVVVDHTEIYKYLPQTDCKECGEQSCYTFAIRIMAGEVELDKCKPFQDAKYATNLEHLQALVEYI
jgi:ArsR family metal-binding transcriptional regulator